MIFSETQAFVSVMVWLRHWHISRQTSLRGRKCAGFSFPVFSIPFRLLPYNNWDSQEHLGKSLSHRMISQSIIFITVEKTQLIKEKPGSLWNCKYPYSNENPKWKVFDMKHPLIIDDSLVAQALTSMFRQGQIWQWPSCLFFFIGMPLDPDIGHSRQQKPQWKPHIRGPMQLIATWRENQAFLLVFYIEQKVIWPLTRCQWNSITEPCLILENA